MKKQTDIAWAAGLFEGEGCIFVARHRAIPQARLEMRITDKDVLERFVSIVDRGKIQSRDYDQAPNSVKRVYKWGVYDIESVRYILGLFAPYLGERRLKKSMEVLHLTRNRKSKREVLTKN